MGLLDFLELFGFKREAKPVAEEPADPSAPRKCNHSPVYVDYQDGTSVKYCKFCRKRWADLVAAGEVSA